jgi:hypothetical protein
MGLRPHPHAKSGALSSRRERNTTRTQALGGVRTSRYRTLCSPLRLQAPRGSQTLGWSGCAGRGTRRRTAQRQGTLWLAHGGPGRTRPVVQLPEGAGLRGASSQRGLPTPGLTAFRCALTDTTYPRHSSSHHAPAPPPAPHMPLTPKTTWEETAAELTLTVSLPGLHKPALNLFRASLPAVALILDEEQGDDLAAPLCRANRDARAMD